MKKKTPKRRADAPISRKNPTFITNDAITTATSQTAAIIEISNNLDFNQADLRNTFFS